MLALLLLSCRGVSFHGSCGRRAHSLVLLLGGSRGSGVIGAGVGTRAGRCFWSVATFVHHVGGSIVLLFCIRVSTLLVHIQEQLRLRAG